MKHSDPPSPIRPLDPGTTGSPLDFVETELRPSRPPTDRDTTPTSPPSYTPKDREAQGG